MVLILKFIKSVNFTRCNFKNTPVLPLKILHFYLMQFFLKKIRLKSSKLYGINFLKRPKIKPIIHYKKSKNKKLTNSQIHHILRFFNN